MEINFSDPNFLPWLIPLGPISAFFIIFFLPGIAFLIKRAVPWLLPWFSPVNIPATSHDYGGHHPDYDGMKVPVQSWTSRWFSVIVGVIGAIIALLIALTVVGYALNPTPEIHHFGEEVYGSVTSQIMPYAWMDTGATQFEMGVLVDPLTTIMLVMVPIAVLMIFIYSIGYMAHDPRQARFFALISLFAGAMLTLVVADNLLMLFVGWEVMGLCSYMLVGFWFEKSSAYKAAIKAFMTTRVADVVMLLGIAYLYANTGTLNFRDILYNPEMLQGLAEAPAIIFGSWGLSAAGLIGVFLIMGTIGKSAQFPLHVWLPDAMEGPTPVSAMIHAAAMVSAGIYAIIRMYPLFAAGGDPHHGVLSQPLLLMAIVGSFTALFAATIAVAQNDVKRVLAYSTISQLGFMMAALGIGAYVAAAFHLITHGFFKALLFMASGSVIHGMEHGEHHVHEHGHHDHEHHDELAHGHAFDPQDMMNMGGLRKTMPVTFITFLIGGLSLAGFPLLTAGFWSKDEILADAWLGVTEGFGPHTLVFIFLALAAFLTAFYTMRQLGLTFWGEARSEAAKHANLGRGLVSATMTLPLIILAVFAITAGFVGVPSDFPILGGIFSPEHNPFHHLVIEALPLNEATEGFSLVPEFHVNAPPFAPNGTAVPFFTSLVVALGGLAVGWLMYWRKPLVAGQEDPLVGILGPVHTVLKNKYYIDEVYVAAFVRPSQWFAKVVNTFLDQGVIDGVLHGTARVAVWTGDLFKVLNSWLIDGVGDGIPQLIRMFGSWFRWLQTGHVQQYLLLVAAAAILIGIIFALSSGALQAAG